MQRGWSQREPEARLLCDIQAVDFVQLAHVIAHQRQVHFASKSRCAGPVWPTTHASLLRWYPCKSATPSRKPARSRVGPDHGIASAGCCRKSQSRYPPVPLPARCRCCMAADLVCFRPCRPYLPLRSGVHRQILAVPYRFHAACLLDQPALMMACNCDCEMSSGIVCAWQNAGKASKRMTPSLNSMG